MFLVKQLYAGPPPSVVAQTPPSSHPPPPHICHSVNDISALIAPYVPNLGGCVPFQSPASTSCLNSVYAYQVTSPAPNARPYAPCLTSPPPPPSSLSAQASSPNTIVDRRVSIKLTGNFRDTVINYIRNTLFLQKD